MKLMIHQVADTSFQCKVMREESYIKLENNLQIFNLGVIHAFYNPDWGQTNYTSLS